MGLTLRIENPSGTSVHELTGERATLGNADDADIRLIGDSIAPQVGELRVVGLTWTLIPASGVALLVNDEPIEGSRGLAMGDVITFGNDAWPRLHIGDAPSRDVLDEVRDAALRARPITREPRGAGVWIALTVIAAAAASVTAIKLGPTWNVSSTPTIAVAPRSDVLPAPATADSGFTLGSTPAATRDDPVEKPAQPVSPATTAPVAESGQVASSSGVFDDKTPVAKPLADAWAEIESSIKRGTATQALLACDQFRKQRRDLPAPLARRVDAAVDDAVDRIWWARIADLTQRQKFWTDNLADADRAVRDARANGVDADTRDRLDADRQNCQENVDQAKRELAELNWSDPTPIDLDQPELLRRLVAKRDAKRLARFKSDVVSHVLQTGGALPW